MKNKWLGYAAFFLFSLTTFAGSPVTWGPNNSLQSFGSSLFIPQIPGTPATVPPVGYDYLYFKADNNLYSYTNGGVETLLGGGGGAGTVTSVGLSLTGPLFTVSGSPVIGAGTLTGTINTQGNNLVFAGPNGGGPLAPTFRSLVAADIPSLSGTYLPLIGGTMSGAIAMGTSKITGLGDPTLIQDAATKNYVDIGLATKEPTITAGTNLQYWRGDKTFQTLNTLAVPELTNLYYTDARARAALNGVSPIGYNSATGDISLTYPLIGTSGTAGAPTFAFSETGNDTGMYSQSDGDISFSNNAGLGMNLDASHNLVVVGSITASNFPVTGTANTFAGYSALGALTSVPAVQFSTVAGATTISSAQTYAIPVDGTPGVIKINNFETEFDAVNPNTDQALYHMAFDSHFDRNHSGNNAASVVGVGTSASVEGSGTLGAHTAFSINQNLLGDSGGTTTNATSLDIGAGPANLYNIGTYRGINLNFNATAGSIVGDVSGIGVGLSGDIGGNYTGLSIAQGGDSAQFSGLNVNQTSGNTGSAEGYRIGFSNGTATGKTAFTAVMGDGVTSGSGRIIEASWNAGDYDNRIGINLGGGSGDITTSDTGLNVGQSSGTSASFQGLNVIADGTTTNWNGAAFSGTATATNVTGVSVNLTSITSPNQKSGITINDGALSVDSNYDTSVLPPSPAFGNLNNVGGTYTVALGFPAVASAMVANNLAANAIFHDDMGPDGFGGLLGFTNVGYLSQVIVDAGVTVDTINSAVAAISIPSGAGGTISNYNGYFAPGVVSFGGTATATNVTAFHSPTTLCSLATNCWGVKIDDPAAANLFVGTVQTNASLILQDPGVGTFAVTLQAPTPAASYTLTLPVDDGLAGEVLSTNGAGVLSWTAALTNSLTNAHIFVGSVGGTATDVAMSGDVSLIASGATTVNTVGGSSAANINAAELLANAATSANTASTIVRRDVNGEFFTSGVKVANAFSGTSTAVTDSSTVNRVFTMPDESGTALVANGSVVHINATSKLPNFLNNSGGIQLNSNVGNAGGFGVGGAEIWLNQYGNNAGHPNLIGYKSRGTLGNNAPARDGDTMLEFWGTAAYDTTGTSIPGQVAEMRFLIDNHGNDPTGNLFGAAFDLQLSDADDVAVTGLRSVFHIDQAGIVSLPMYGTAGVLHNAVGTGEISSSPVDLAVEVTGILPVANLPAGIVSLNTTTKVANYTAVKSDVVLCNATGGAFTVTLPLAAANTNASIRVKKIDSSANAITLAASGADLVDGGATQSLPAQYDSVELISDGVNWYAF